MERSFSGFQAQFMPERLSDFQSRARKSIFSTIHKYFVDAQIRFLLFAEESDLKSHMFDLSPYLDSSSEPRDGELFDSSRVGINKVVSDLFDWLPDRTSEETQKMMKFGREIYSFVMTKFLKKSLSAKDPEYRQSLKGITWSIMAKDIDKTMCPWGQSPLSPGWKDGMRDIIFSDRPDMEVAKSELEKFVSGNEKAFVV
jgi:hypothetical protein